MTRLAIFGLSAAALIAGLLYAGDWLRKDAQADLLRDLARAQAEREARDAAELSERKEEIENETPDDLRLRACRNGWLPADACGSD